ncbi:MAG: hypothetical protein RLZZ618_3020 [Pseudomonadota bacterium]
MEAELGDTMSGKRADDSSTGRAGASAACRSRTGPHAPPTGARCSVKPPALPLILSLGAAVALSVPLAAHALAYSDLSAMSIEDLATLEITSVSKKTELVADASASVFVITASDIERSGATSLPEALRLAPNLQVARVDARNYAVTARGFNGPFANKLLVLIDGRSIYTPLFSGVFWDAQDVMLEDIDRIEVVSGAGSTLWGANAVNGVINVVTRSAAKTQGTLVAVSGAEQEQTAAIRHGDVLAGTQFRVYAKRVRVTDSHRANSSSVVDGFHRSQAGLRADGGDEHQGFTLLADAYSGRLSQANTRDIHTAGFSSSAQWRQRLREGSSVALQFTFDHTQRDQPGSFDERLDIANIELQHTVELGGSHHMVWGGGYRHATDRLNPEPGFAFLPNTMSLHWGNVFVQDDIALRRDLRLTLGLKLEHNGYTGYEHLPNIRLAYKPTGKHLIWASAARTARAPSRIDRDFYAPTSPPVVGGVQQFFIAGGPNFQNEIAKLFELGYRGQLLPSVTWSVTAFSAKYDGLRTFEPNTSGPGLVFGNGAEATSRGVEMWGAWQVSPTWRLHAGVVSQAVRTTYKADSRSPARLSLFEDTDPHHYWTLRSSTDLNERTSLDVSLRHVGALRNPEVPAYDALDANLIWRVRAGLAVSLLGKNLLDSGHPEFGAANVRSEIDRSVVLKAIWQL